MPRTGTAATAARCCAATVLVCLSTLGNHQHSSVNNFNLVRHAVTATEYSREPAPCTRGARRRPRARPSRAPCRAPRRRSPGRGTTTPAGPPSSIRSRRTPSGGPRRRRSSRSGATRVRPSRRRICLKKTRAAMAGLRRPARAARTYVKERSTPTPSFDAASKRLYGVRRVGRLEHDWRINLRRDSHHDVAAEDKKNVVEEQAT